MRDGHGSIITIESSVVGGANRQVVSATIETGNSSVMLLRSANVIGSVATLQGTLPWAIAGSVLSFPGANQSVSGAINITGNPSISGTVNIGTIPGSVIAFQGGGWTPSAIAYLYRNDALASTLGADLTYGPGARDSAGRILTRPYSPEESRIEGYSSTVNVSVTTLVAAAGAGLRNYITDVWVANTGAAATLVTFRSGGGTSVLGYTIAPAGSGSNLPGLVTPIRTLANETFDFQASTGTSVLYATVKGFKAP